MNSVSTTWFRACRAPCRNIVPTCSSSSSKMTSFSVSRAPQRIRAPHSRQQVTCLSSLRSVREAQRVHDDAPFPRASAAAARPSPDLSSPATTTGSVPLSGGTPSNSTVSDTQAPKEEQNDATKKTPAKGHTMVGRVSRVGTMNKTVRVSRTVQVWDRHLRKYYKRKAHDMVHDPDNTLNEGDVVEYGGAETRRKPAPVVAGTQIEGTGTGTRKNVKYVVHQVITPFGLPVDVRPPRTVGSPKGRWEGTAGEVIKGNVRQRARGKSKAH